MPSTCTCYTRETLFFNSQRHSIPMRSSTGTSWNLLRVIVETELGSCSSKWPAAKNSSFRCVFAAMSEHPRNLVSHSENNPVFSVHGKPDMVVIRDNIRCLQVETFAERNRPARTNNLEISGKYGMFSHMEVLGRREFKCKNNQVTGLRKYFPAQTAVESR